MDAKPAIIDLPSLARARVHIGPNPDWITPVTYDQDYEPQVRGSTTWLLSETQVQVDLGATYMRTVVRLETMQSVQHYSQWRLEFEPQTESIVLHNIKIRRGSAEIEHGSLERIQFLQREADLEGFIIDGWITLLLLLEDVRPDDILEYAYTVTTRRRLLPNHASRFFSLPAGVEVGKYHFLVRHPESRGMKWLSSSPSLTPAITTEGANLVWIWSGEKIATPEPEAYTSSWQLDFPWIQISDCPDWQTVACAFAKGWEETTGAGFEKFIEEIRTYSGDPLAQVNRAIELIQDDFRYLSVNLKLGGQIPAPAETVIRRRYGDCKDVTFLLVQTLRALGIYARPVLVDSFWQKSVTSMLPSDNLFNHVIVEYKIGDEVRWVDATHKSQGGGALKRSIPDYGVGLPIDPTTTALATVPKASLPSGTYELKESFLLDTAGQPSFFAQVITATGEYANSLRWEFTNEGVEAVAKRRLQACANRFSWAGRVGTLQYRDNRETNEFVVAEVFEITGFLKEQRKSNTCPFLIESSITTEMLLAPSLAPRRNPFAIPFPCHLTYSVEIDFTGFNPAAMPSFSAKNEYFSFTRRTKALPKFFKVTFTLETLANAVPPDHLAKHRKLVESVWHESAIWIHLPAGYARMRKRSDFGALPIPPRTPAVSPEPQHLSTAVVVPLKSAPPPKNEPGTVVELQPLPAKTEGGIDCLAVSQPPISPVAKKNLAPPLQKFSPAATPYRRRGVNQRCLLSLWLALGAFVLFVVSLVVGKAYRADKIAGSLLFLCFPLIAGAVSLAVSGWKQCAQPPRKPQSGRAAAAAAFGLSGLLGFILLFALINTIGNRIGNGGRRALKFEALGFVFHPLESPWEQIDARMIGAGTTLSFARPGDLFFAVNVNGLEAGYSDPLGRVVELVKTDIKAQMVSYQLISETTIPRNGLVGRQLEIEANFQGQNLYLVQWLSATNGWGYQLSMWGPRETKSLVKAEADRVFLNFESTVSNP